MNRSMPTGMAHAKGGASGSAYVTFRRSQEAQRCVETIDGIVWSGAPQLMAAFRPGGGVPLGTTPGLLSLCEWVLHVMAAVSEEGEGMPADHAIIDIVALQDPVSGFC